MRQIGNFVDRLDALCGGREGGGDVAMAAAVRQLPIERGAVFGAKLAAVGGGGGAKIHATGRAAAPPGAPEIVGGDRDSIGDRQDGQDSPRPATFEAS